MRSEPIRLSVLPEFRCLAGDERRATFVARIDPPAVPAERPGARVVLALDTSASMGYGRLVSALDCASALVHALGTRDTFACVTFGTDVSVLVHPTAMTGAGRDLALSALRGAAADGGTNLGAGLGRALGIAGVLHTGVRVLLLTDGCPTEGVTGAAELVGLVRGARGAIVSTFGFGRDVDPTLLLALAESGRGSYTFIDAGERPMDPIGAELGSILRTAAIDVSLTLTPGSSARVVRVDSGGRLTLEPALGSVQVELGPLVAGEPVHVAFELAWDAPAEPIATLELSARLTETEEVISCAARVGAASGPARGEADPAACKEILLARAAAALRAASLAELRAPGEIAAEIDAQRQALERGARALGLASDEQMIAALAMVERARDGLSAAAERAVRAARQDLAAVAIALGQRRSSMFSPDARQGAFVTPSQQFGRRLLDDLWEQMRRAR